MYFILIKIISFLFFFLADGHRPNGHYAERHFLAERTLGLTDT